MNQLAQDMNRVENKITRKKEMEVIEKEISKAHGGVEEALRQMETRLAARVKEDVAVSGDARKSELPTGHFTQEGLGKYDLKKYVDRLFANKQGYAEEMKEAVKPAEKQADKQARKKLPPSCISMVLNMG